MRNNRVQDRSNNKQQAASPITKQPRAVVWWYTAAVALIAACLMVACGTSNGNPEDLNLAGTNGISTGAGGAMTTTTTTTTAAGGTSTTTVVQGGKGGSITSGGGAGTGKAGTGGSGKAGANGTVAGSGGKAGAAGQATGGSGGSSSSCIRPAEQVEMANGPGPYTATHIENGGDSGTSWVFYPKEIGENGCLHPVFNWGPGAGTGPAEYTEHLNHLASHGFVIISQPSSGTGTTEKASLTWLIDQNEKSGSPFYKKLDTKKVVMGGHSMGALTTLAMADDPRLTLYILVCGGSGSGTTGAANMHAPSIFLGGEGESGTANFEADYAATKSPSIFITKTSTDHIMCARNNMAPWTAFMRWQLYGEEKWKKDLFDNGTYCKSPWLACKSKGF
jgi:hypothetical protein